MIKKLVFTFLFFFADINHAKDSILIVTEEYPPYNYTNKKGEIVGSSTDIIKKVMANTDIDYRIEILSWAKAFHLAKNNPNTLIYTIYRIAQREPSFQWICPLNHTQGLKFYTLKSTKNLTINNLDDVKNYLVGAVKDDVTYDYLISHNFKEDKHLDIATDEFANVRKLLKGRVDLIIQEEQALKFRLKREGISFNKVKSVFTLFDKSLNNSCMAFGLKTPIHIVNKVSKALKAVNKSIVIK